MGHYRFVLRDLDGLHRIVGLVPTQEVSHVLQTLHWGGEGGSACQAVLSRVGATYVLYQEVPSIEGGTSDAENRSDPSWKGLD
jgi:hypothetical protein